MPEQEQQGNPYQAFEDKYGSLTTVDFIRKMHEIRMQKDALEDQASELGKHHRYLSEVLIPMRFDADGIKILKIDGVGRCNLQSDMQVSVKAGSKDEAWTFLRDTGRGDLIQPQVNASSLKASCKKALLAGEPFPEELFNINPITRAVITKT